MSPTAKEGKPIEEYKIWVDLYYKEVGMFYTKNTIFNTLQVFLMGCYLINKDKLSSINTYIVSAMIFLFLCISLLQVLISKRGYDVNQSIIEAIRDFEDANNFSVLKDFSNKVNKKHRIGKMNFPSYVFIILSSLYSIFWSVILFFELNVIDLIKKIPFNNLPFTSNSVSVVVVLLLSIIYAIIMKLADLCNEHGFKWFKGDAIILGILNGVIGTILMAINPIISNAILAMILCYILRGLIDYPNHRLAAVMNILFFIMYCKIETIWFAYFMFCFIVFGFIKNLKYKGNKSKLVKVVCKIYIYVPIIYTLPTLLYSIITSDWIVFFSLSIFDFTYNIVRLTIEKKGVKKYYT